jgi:hypothetical protein
MKIVSLNDLLIDEPGVGGSRSEWRILASEAEAFTAPGGFAQVARNHL